MNAALQSQLDRIETALSSLTDSITSYNPSVPAAQELLAADAAFQKGIDQLTRHQQNYTRLLSLRSKAESLSTGLNSSLALLAETRTAILATSAPSLPLASSLSRRPVPHSELLSVSRSSAKYAAPVGYQPPTTATQIVAPEEPKSTEEAGTQPGTQLGTQQSQGPTQGTTQTVDTSPSTQQQHQQSSFATQATQSTNPGLSLLEDAEKLWLDPLTNTPYLPWPSDEMVARSGLARSQNWQGAVPEEGPPPSAMEGVEADGPKEVVDVAEGQGANMEEPRRRESVQVREEKPKVFEGFDLYDPDDD